MSIVRLSGVVRCVFSVLRMMQATLEDSHMSQRRHESHYVWAMIGVRVYLFSIDNAAGHLDRRFFPSTTPSETCIWQSECRSTV